MKLSKKDRAKLDGMLHDFKKAQAYLRSQRIVVCTTMLPNALSFYDKNGTGISPVNVEIGSSLHRLHAGIDNLETFLASTEK